MINLREQVKPLLFGDGLLPQQLQNYGTHQVPFVLKLKGAFVLQTDRRDTFISVVAKLRLETTTQNINVLRRPPLGFLTKWSPYFHFLDADLRNYLFIFWPPVPSWTGQMTSNLIETAMHSVLR